MVIAIIFIMALNSMYFIYASEEIDERIKSATFLVWPIVVFGLIGIGATKVLGDISEAPLWLIGLGFPGCFLFGNIAAHYYDKSVKENGMSNSE